MFWKLDLTQLATQKESKNSLKPEKSKNIYDAVTQKTWNNCQEINHQKQHILDMDHSDTVHKHTAK